MCEHGIYTRVQTYRLVYMHVYIAELIEPLVEVIRHPLDSETLLADAAAALWLLAERNLPNAAAIRKTHTRRAQGPHRISRSPDGHCPPTGEEAWTAHGRSGGWKRDPSGAHASNSTGLERGSGPA